MHGIHGGRVLDVATGSGGFVRTLVDELASYDEIVGIDISGAGADAFAKEFQGERAIRFQVADALAMPFPDESFDAVAICSSLHHFVDPSPALAEMRRVLRPGGAFIVSEMYRDHQTKPQLTHVRLHHWAAAVDWRLGVIHRPTWRRGQIIDVVGALGLEDLRLDDWQPDSADPLDPERLSAHDPIIDRFLERAAGRGDLIERGHAIRRRLHAVGITQATQLLLAGDKVERMAERAGFEPAMGCPIPHFQCGALGL